jgi:hypothetical protein
MNGAFMVVGRSVLPIALVVALSAHVGSPNVVFDGAAGPYAVRVIVRPPQVVPGLAEVIVRVGPAAAGDVSTVNIRPVFWRAGVTGAPKGDNAARVAGQPNLYSGQLWLMSRGSYSVYVTVSGPRGSGTAIVPVSAFATGRLGLSRGLTAILIVLGLLLFAGLITIVQAASGESLLEPGQKPDATTKRRARLAGLIAAPILGVLVLGGARWWGSVDAQYRLTMYRPPGVETNIVGETDGSRTLWLRVRDTAAFRAIFAPVIPDHGKMMHLFLIREGTHDVFAHFHPAEVDSLYFRTSVPWLPAGQYRFFGDVVLANGLSQTVTSRFMLGGGPKAEQRPSDPDDSWATAPAASGSTVPIGDGYTLARTSDASIASGTPVDLRFEVRNSAGAVTNLQPYLGMSAHAVVLKSDESVFIHLHPMGTVAAVAQRAFAARDRGDTTADGRLRLADGDTMPMRMTMDGHLVFPYEFPGPGRYRIWVQVKPDKQVLTGAFDVDVR